jgi:hypothetical protein
MRKHCTKASGARPWTEEEMMAYVNWNRAEDSRVDASLIANPLNPGKRGIGDVLMRAERDKQKQQVVKGVDSLLQLAILYQRVSQT